MPTADSNAPTRLDELAATWQQEAARLRARSTNDVTADLLDYCAGELRTALTALRSDDEELSPQEYADLQDVSVSTVRRWCKTGALLARKVGRDWAIRRGEPAPHFGSRDAAA